MDDSAYQHNQKERYAQKETRLKAVRRIPLSDAAAHMLRDTPVHFDGTYPYGCLPPTIPAHLALEMTRYGLIVSAPDGESWRLTYRGSLKRRMLNGVL